MLVAEGRDNREMNKPFFPGQEDRKRLPSLRGGEAKKLSDTGLTKDFFAAASLDKEFVR